jgi:tetratricopeptide (TPR) repeat protein
MKKAVTSFLLFVFFSLLSWAQLSPQEKKGIERIYNEGVDQLLNSDFIEAISSFDQCLQLDEGYALAYLNRGRVKAALGDYAAAITDLDQAILYDPDLGEAYFYKGYFLFDKDATYACELIEISIEKGFQLAESYYFLGLNMVLKGDNDKALIHFNRAIRLKDDFALAYHDRAAIKRGFGDYSGALYDYKSAVNYQEHFPIAYNSMGTLKMIMGDYDGAIADFSKAIEQEPELHLAYNNRGYARFQLGEMDSAYSDFNEAMHYKPDFLEAKLNMSHLLVKLERANDALELLDQIILENPDAGLIFLNRGLVKEITGDVVGACLDWKIAKELGETQADEYLNECNQN